MALPRQTHCEQSVVEPMTIEEYLAFERSGSVRHEYVEGYLYAFAGATRRHNNIILNLVVELRPAVRARGCVMYTESVQLRASESTYYYPDFMIGCDPAEAGEYELERPCVIAEVLSHSTSRSDRVEKLDVYRQIPSMRCYMVVSQSQRRIDWHVRGEDGVWESGVTIGEGSVPIPPFDIEVALDAVYRDVRIEPTPGDSASEPTS